MSLPLGEQIDALYEMDQKIKAANSKVTLLKQKRDKMDLRLQRSFKKQQIEGSKGKQGVASIRETKHPQIKDRGKLDKWVLKHKALDLFTSHMSSTAYFERLEEGQSIPGVEVFPKTRISVTKRK